MTYLRILRLIDAVLRRCENATGWWTLADWRGRLAFQQIEYAKRVQKASGWEPVTVTYQPGPSVTSVHSGGTFTTTVSSDSGNWWIGPRG